jgi:hypothetical protein
VAGATQRKADLAELAAGVEMVVLARVVAFLSMLPQFPK